jgi:hypothetical protein
MRKFSVICVVVLTASCAAPARVVPPDQVQSQFAPSQGQLVSPANPVTPSSAFDAANSYGSLGTYRGAVRYNPLATPGVGDGDVTSAK